MKIKRIRNWNVLAAIDEIEAYSDLLDGWEKETDSGGISNNKRVGLISAQAIMSSYAFEIAIKSFFELDNPDRGVPATHNLVTLYDELNDDTKKLLKQVKITGQNLKDDPEPFLSNRYSMGYDCREECRVECKAECRKRYKERWKKYCEKECNEEGEEECENKLRREHEKKCEKECKKRCRKGCGKEFKWVVYSAAELRKLAHFLTCKFLWDGTVKF